MTVFGREDELFLHPRATLLSEVLAADILEDGEAERVEQKVPGLVLLLYKAACRQAESVSDCAGQQQHIQLRQRPLTATAPRWRLGKQESTQVLEPGEMGCPDVYLRLSWALIQTRSK